MDGLYRSAVNQAVSNIHVFEAKENVAHSTQRYFGLGLELDNFNPLCLLVVDGLLPYCFSVSEVWLVILQVSFVSLLLREFSKTLCRLLLRLTLVL